MVVRNVECLVRIAFIDGFLRCLLIKPRLDLGRRSAGGGHQAIARALLQGAHLIPERLHRVAVDADLRQFLPHGLRALRHVLIDLRQHPLQRKQDRSRIVLAHRGVVGWILLLLLLLWPAHHSRGAASTLDVVDRPHRSN